MKGKMNMEKRIDRRPGDQKEEGKEYEVKCNTSIRKQIALGKVYFTLYQNIFLPTKPSL